MKHLTKGIFLGLGIGICILCACIFFQPAEHPDSQINGSDTQNAEPEEPSAETTVPEEETDVSSDLSAKEQPQPEQTPPGDSFAAEETVLPEEEHAEETTPEETAELPQEAVLAFAGDVMFSEQYLAAYDRNGIQALASEQMLAEMRDADLFMLNEEFPFSLRGEPMEDKQYTFRTDPKYVSILQDLGTDLVTVANNHALDFGQDAFCDTLDTLKQAGITCVGGGYHIAEASAPAVCTVNGQTFAIFAATRVSPSYDWYATDSQPGMFQTYDPTKLNAAIAEAEETYDHTIVFVHWGIEHVEYPEDYQRALAKGYIDAGADLIIGCHPHILQGFEYYRDVPVIYSLGNYLFGNRDGNTLLLKAVFHADGALDIRLVPCKRQNGILSVIEEPNSLYQHLTELSFHAEVSAEGVLRSSVTE
ncbi:MAG: CapA family protein [Lachnospiraceae bacterium]|nr:CapA family protein [Lachnospiraceae bacterium]